MSFEGNMEPFLDIMAASVDILGGRTDQLQKAKIRTKNTQNHDRKHIFDHDFAIFLYKFLLFERGPTSEDVYREFSEKTLKH